jgi:hypothetical protein
MEGLSLQVLDTVDGETPARAATSFKVTAIKTDTSWVMIVLILGENGGNVNGVSV